MLDLIGGDNLDALRALARAGALFDLVEVDGPWGVGLESWDVTEPGAFLAHSDKHFSRIAPAHGYRRVQIRHGRDQVIKEWMAPVGGQR